MIPVLTPAEMAAADAAAIEPVDVLIERAGAGLARAALEMLGGAYGRRVLVVAGRGNNGADGRVAARRLAARGVVVSVESPGSVSCLPETDLVIDAAYGTGFRGSCAPGSLPVGVPVLAADLPSGVDGLTGIAAGRPWRADRTVTFAAMKPGLLFADGPQLSGRIQVEAIGLDVGSTQCHLVEPSDLAAWVLPRERSAHKWQSATWIIGGSAGMTGAPTLAALGAWRAGASYVRTSTPGAPLGSPILESVAVALPAVNWDRSVLSLLDRLRSLVVGPGLGRNDAVAQSVRSLYRSASVPMVLDGDALWALAPAEGLGSATERVLTPHDGEFAQLTGHPVGDDRIAAARSLAARRGCVVLLKGPTTVVASPDGRTRLIVAGDQRLATAGTGDVLAGVIGGLLAAGLNAFDAAAAGAEVHGLAARAARSVGMIASDLPPLIADLLGGLERGEAMR